MVRIPSSAGALAAAGCLQASSTLVAAGCSSTGTQRRARPRSFARCFTPASVNLYLTTTDTVDSGIRMAVETTLFASPHRADAHAPRVARAWRSKPGREAGEAGSNVRTFIEETAHNGAACCTRVWHVTAHNGATCCTRVWHVLGGTGVCAAVVNVQRGQSWQVAHVGEAGVGHVLVVAQADLGQVWERSQLRHPLHMARGAHSRATETSQGLVSTRPRAVGLPRLHRVCAFTGTTSPSPHPDPALALASIPTQP